MGEGGSLTVPVTAEQIEAGEILKRAIHDRAEEILEHYCGPGVRRGHELWFRAPYRDDNNASLRWNAEKRQWYDDPIAGGGDIFHFGAKLLRLDHEQDFPKIVAAFSNVLGLAAGNETPALPAPARKNAKIDPEAEPHFATLDEIKAKYKSQGRVLPYPYTRSDGSLYGYVIRIETTNGKRITNAHEYKPGRWVERKPDWWKDEGKQKSPPLQANKIAGAERVVIVEGEKCAAVLSNIGILATTTWGGAGKAKHTDWAVFSGVGIVYLWPDNDDAGRSHMEDVRALLEALPNPPRIYTVDIDALSLRPKADVVDLFALYFDPAKPDTEEVRGKKRQMVEDILADAKSNGAGQELKDHMESIIAGKYRAEPFPFEMLTRATKATYPETVTICGGSPGAGKSFFELQCDLFWWENGLHVEVLMTEDKRKLHLQRLLAQRCAFSKLTDDEWIRNHPEKARDVVARHMEFFEKFGRYITAEDRLYTYAEVLEWASGALSRGSRIIVIDPITGIKNDSRQPWSADLDFMFQLKSLCRKHEASAILITHPRKSQQNTQKRGPSQDDCAGGAAFARFAHTMLWLEYMVNGVEREVFANGETNRRTINREMWVLKARNGKGAGQRIGFYFDPETLLLAEQGVINT
jgi:hypothetical protein